MVGRDEFTHQLSPTSTTTADFADTEPRNPERERQPSPMYVNFLHTNVASIKPRTRTTRTKAMSGRGLKRNVRNPTFMPYFDLSFSGSKRQTPVSASTPVLKKSLITGTSLYWHCLTTMQMAKTNALFDVCRLKCRHAHSPFVRYKISASPLCRLCCLRPPPARTPHPATAHMLTHIVETDHCGQHVTSYGSCHDDEDHLPGSAGDVL